MELILASSGSYPRIGDTPKGQILRRTIAKWEKGKAPEAELRDIENEVTKAAIKEQIKAGLELITDGQIRWYDPISHISRKLKGISINGLLRFFDTNFYFRQPVIEAKPRWINPILVDEFLFAKSVSKKPLKPVITGPYTLAKFSIRGRDKYKDFGKLVHDYALGIKKEIEMLSEAGARIIQVDEPAILKYPKDFGFLEDGIKTISKGKGSLKLALYTYFGDVAPLYKKLQKLPVDIIGIDFTYNANLVEMVSQEGSDKSLGLGLIDGRNTKLESGKEVFAALEKILPSIKSDVTCLNPSCGLEYLPRDRASEKLKNMARIKKEFLGERKGRL